MNDNTNPKIAGTIVREGNELLLVFSNLFTKEFAIVEGDETTPLEFKNGELVLLHEKNFSP